MKQYKILEGSEDTLETLENEMNKLAEEGYSLEQFTSTCSERGYNYYTAVMSIDKEAQAQKQRVKDFLDSYGNYVEKAIEGELTDEELEELNEEVLGRIKKMYGKIDFNS